MTRPERDKGARTRIRRFLEWWRLLGDDRKPFHDAVKSLSEAIRESVIRDLQAGGPIVRRSVEPSDHNHLTVSEVDRLLGVNVRKPIYDAGFMLISRADYQDLVRKAFPDEETPDAG